eukprot:8631258-Alexandrium_andersonii.AAC.1
MGRSRAPGSSKAIVLKSLRIMKFRISVPSGEQVNKRTLGGPKAFQTLSSLRVTPRAPFKG